MSNITLRNGEHHLRALLRHSPFTAARNGVLAVVHDGLVSIDALPAAEDLSEAAAPLTSVLDVPDLDAVDGALCALNGRPPAAVSRALTSPRLVSTLCHSLDMLGAADCSDQVARWGPRNPDRPGEALPLEVADRASRWELVSALRVRTAELLAAWRARGMIISAELANVDGRSLTAAARTWQVPMITGTLPPAPEAAAALHPNRLGRTAATVAYSRIGSLVRSPAPDAAVFEPLALMVAVGEAVSVEDLGTAREGDGEIGMMSWNSSSAQAAVRGQLPVQVRDGHPVRDEAADLNVWWSVFSSWGSTSKRLATAIPTAWRLSAVEADVLVWAMCSAAARIATAASMPSEDAAVRKLGVRHGVSWEDHWAAEFPRWEAGARSVWVLMQKGRRFESRTPWPMLLAPAVDTESSWPWRPRS